VLPEDRADVLYHRYEGGGVTVDGPSLLVRRKIGENYSVAANYCMDFVSSASIDVMTQASPYKEERRQASLGFDMMKQDPVQRRLHQQRRERLHGRYGQRRPEPTAVSFNARYFVWYRAAIHGGYRYFTDSWGVDANTVRVGYTQPLGDRWIVEFNYRWYDQSAATRNSARSTARCSRSARPVHLGLVLAKHRLDALE